MEGRVDVSGRKAAAGCRRVLLCTSAGIKAHFILGTVWTKKNNAAVPCNKSQRGGERGGKEWKRGG